MDTRLGRSVAVKILPENLSSQPERLHRFEKEARAASSLNHPNIVTIYDIGTSNSRSYIAMELVEGKSWELLNTGRPLAQAFFDRDAAHRRPGQGARGGDRAPGLEAREPDGDPRRLAEDSGFRAGEADAAGLGIREGSRIAPGDDVGWNGAGRGHGYGGVHVAGAGERAAGWIFTRINSRSARFSTRWQPERAPSSGRPPFRPCRRSSRTSRRRSLGDTETAGELLLDRRALSGQGAGAAIRFDKGPGTRSGSPPGPRLGDLRFAASRSGQFAAARGLEIWPWRRSRRPPS